MYPVSIGYAGAVARINALLINGHDAEALVTAVFTAEKTLRRTLRQLIVSAGFSSNIADKIVRRLNGVFAVADAWELYDPRNRKLTTVIAPVDWQTFREAAEMRNQLVHGTRVYDLAECRNRAASVLSALSSVKTALDREYGYSGWTPHSVRRKAQLHNSPKVTWTS